MKMTLCSISSFPTLFLPVSSNPIKIIPKGKPKKFKGSPFNQKLHTSPPKPQNLFRLRLDHYCFNFFLSGVIVSSNVNFFLSAADALENPNAEFNRYPCEDVVGYYSGVDGLTGDALMKELGSIINPHKSLPYKKVWEALKFLDAADIDNPEASSEVIEIYSQRAVSKALAGKPEGWNREHLWPRSYGLRNGPSLTDLHNIRPADVNVNSSRGNKYYGECDVLSNHCLRPANQEAAPDTETDKQRWAPPKQVRGDVARSVMYMALSYGFLQPGGNSYLQLSNSPSMDVSTLRLISYNGANGRAYRSLALADKNISAVSDVGSSGFLIYTGFIPLQNGPSDGTSLASGEEVLQFLSYEGRLKAVDGPAQGMESADIMKGENENSPDND